MTVKSYFIQLYGFIVKVFTQRLRSPVATFVEVLLPCVFILLLGACYWAADTTNEPSKLKDGGDNVVMNYSQLGTYFFCTSPTSSIKTVYNPCSTPNITCLKKVGNGDDVCYMNAMKPAMMGIMFPLFLQDGPVGPFSMDMYLTWSALVTEMSEHDSPATLRTAKASLAHYGELVVVSDSAALGAEFVSFCRQASGMCGSIVNPNVFSNLDAAKDYANANSGRVWSIVTLPSNAVTTTSGNAEFTISMNFSATPWTYKKNTRTLFTPPEEDTSAGYILYSRSGFLTMQTFVQEFFLQRNLAANIPFVGKAVYDAAAGTNANTGIGVYVSQSGAALIPMPTVPTYKNAFLTSWGYYAPFVLVMAALFPVARLVLLIVEEKPKGIREAMLIMGMNPTCMFAGWYVSSLLVDFVAALLASMLLKVSFMNRVDYGVLLALYLTFLQNCTALAILLSTMFSNPRIASWFGAFVLFVCAMGAYEFPAGMPDIAKLFVCFLPCVGYTDSMLTLLDRLSSGLHYGWSDAHGTYNVASAIGMTWASFAIMMVLALYFDRVWPASVGRREHPLFFLAPLLRLCRSEQVPLVQMCPDGASCDPAAAGGADADDDVDAMKARNMIEHRDDAVDPRDPTIAAVFDRLRKVYICGGLFGFFYTFFTGVFRRGDRVVALDSVTFAMKRGEVSVLLGPNGAGKSTIMGMASGMIRPTSGEVYIGGLSVSGHLSECRQKIGYCSQQDIVWADLTVAEHLSFYARLKGCETLDVQSHVDEAIELVGLEEKRDCFASKLSGGQRRRLCVAIALVADSSVLLLDEPTAGMDTLGRRTVYDALNRARANRSVLLSTHLLDEADRIGDRILLVNGGRLCAEGSSMFLKSQMSVGYVVTCVLESGMQPAEESRAASALVDFVRAKGYAGHRAPDGGVEAVPAGCKLLGVERRGREVCFRFPMALLSSSGHELLSALQDNSGELRLRSVGLNLTTLEDVFMTAVRDKPLMSAEPADGYVLRDTLSDDMKGSNSDDDNAMYHNNTPVVTFCRHFRALLLKRMHFAKRDMKLLIFQVVLPVVFLLLSLFINLVQPPSQPSLLLDNSMYDDVSALNPSEVLMMASPVASPNAFGLNPFTPGAALGTDYKVKYYPFSDPTVSPINATLVLSRNLQAEIESHASPRHIALAPVGRLSQSGPPMLSSAVMHNVSYPHAAPQGVDALYHLTSHQLFGTQVPKLTVRNDPMRIAEFDRDLVDAAKQVMIGIFVILPFVFIPSNTICYIVREKESGARHMQWLSGASIAAYWLSSFVFDALCFIGTEILTFVLFVIFGRQEYIGEDVLGASIVLFLVFGLSSIPLSYLLSIFFDSPFVAQTVVLVVNFSFGLMWVTIESMLAPSALTFVRTVSYVVRVLPSVCFGEGMFVLAGQRMSKMLLPPRDKPNMFGLLHLIEGGDFRGGIGTGLIYMCSVAVVSSIALVVLEYIRVQRALRVCACCCTPSASDDVAEPVDGELCGDDAAVAAEEARVCADYGGPESDCIAVQNLRKWYRGMNRPAVKDVSFGVHEGEIMGLLGLNGAGKSTIMSIIAGEVMASGGAAFVNHVSVERTSSRSFIGYCPQYDPLLDCLSPVEHLWLYARLRGMREELIGGEVRMLIRELGLYPHRAQAAQALSGGNKRRLSLAIALVGRTTSVLLDEPTAGMDTVARAQTCAVVKRLTQDKSVILTTHLLDEVDALADRVAFIAAGSVHSIGTPQELKSQHTGASTFTVGVTFHHDVDLTSADAAVPAALQSHVLAQLTALSTDSKESTDKGDVRRCTIGCDVTEVHVSSVQLSVCAPLKDICRVVAELRAGVDDVPAVDYVSVSQTTLDDILLKVVPHAGFLAE